MLLTHRKLLQLKAIAIENDLRGTLRNFGLKVGMVGKVKFEARIQELVENIPDLALLVEPLLIVRRALREQIVILHRHLLAIVREDEVCRRLMTTPGVGPVVALTYRATVDVPARLRKSKSVGAVFGLTCAKYQSGEIDWSGRISRKAAGKREIALSPIAIEIVRRIDALFAIERSINGQSADHRKAVRQARSAPLVADLEAYMREQCAKLSRGHDLAKAMNYMFKRWGSFTRFLDDGRVCLSNNAAERALRGIALGRKSWLFCGSDRGGRRAAAMYSLIVSAKMNDVDPRAWLADVLARIAAHPAHRLDELLPWNWKTAQQQGLAMQAA